MDPQRGSITDLLEGWRQGDARARSILMERVYPELRSIARGHLRRRGDPTLEPAALVHEAYGRLVKQDIDWRNRSQFYALSSLMMRRVLVDAARARQRRGKRITIATDIDGLGGKGPVDIDVLALDMALDRLEQELPLEAQVVQLRYFGGLTIPEAAAYLDVGHATVERAWKLAKAWLFRELSRA